MAQRSEDLDSMPSVRATERPPRRWWQRTWLKVVALVAVVGMAALIVVAEYALHHIEPMLRARVVETLSARFHSPVELDHLDVSMLRGVTLGATGVAVEGDGLRILYLAGANQPDNDSNAPMLSVKRFVFRTRLRSLLHSPTRITEVDVDGMVLHIPPGNAREQILDPNAKKRGRQQPMITLLLDRILCRDVTLIVDTTKPGKAPMEFDIQTLELHDVAQSQPFLYRAELINPKPVGEVHAEGHFGPWDPEDPRETPLDGSYHFDHADLSTIKGIRGMLSSHGQFAGVLDHITIDGETETPDFALDESEHPVPLHTVFHAYVDGTSGDTYLDPVHARLLASDFTASGKVVRVEGQGHDIDLDVDIPHGRMQDFLELAVKTRPPLMNAVLAMKGHLHIPPGPQRVPLKLQLAGAFQLHGVEFNSPGVQDKIDGLSARAQGRPKEVATYGNDRRAEVSSAMSANFSIAHGTATVEDLRYQIPGATVLLNGVYSMDGNVFEFKGHVRTQASASQMVTGWKSWLLKPVDPFLRRDGAGLELPIEVSGTNGDVHFGLAMHGSADESAQKIATDLKQNRAALLAAARAGHSREQRYEAEKPQRQTRSSVPAAASGKPSPDVPRSQ